MSAAGPGCGCSDRDYTEPAAEAGRIRRDCLGSRLTGGARGIMFDSPFEFCKVCRQYVLLDQTQRECAREHACTDATSCPLRCCFTGIEFGKAADDAKERRARSRK